MGVSASISLFRFHRTAVLEVPVGGLFFSSFFWGGQDLGAMLLRCFLHTLNRRFRTRGRQ